MLLNAKTEYALRAMIEINHHEPSSGILQKEISEVQEIPIKYLDSIITGLRTAGLIVNFSGKSHGYKLSKPPDEVSVYDIYRAFQPELLLVNCLNQRNSCKSIKTCTARDYWTVLNDQITTSMKSATLDQFVK